MINEKEKVIAGIVASAKDWMLEKGSMPPMFYAWTGMDQCFLFCVPFRDNRERTFVLSSLRMTFRVLKVKRYAVAHEAWLAEPIPGEEYNRNKKSLEHYPGRKEVLVVAYVDYSERNLINFELLRDGTGKIEGFEKMGGDFKDIAGDFVELLPGDQPVPNLRERLFVERFLEQFGKIPRT